MGARIFNIPTGVPFADALAAGLLHRHGGDPDALGRVTVLLPTRRACRSLREAFVRVHSGALMLPLLRPLGDVEEDALALSGTADHWEGDTSQALDLPPAITPLRRQMLLGRLVLKTEIGMVPDRALFLASELGTLLDLMQTEDVGFEALAGIVPGDLAKHWQKTLTFMELVTQNWPEILAEVGALDPADRRKFLMKAQADHWRATPPSDPVYAAGSTGTVPATAELMAVIAALPNGAIVLPGLDVTLDSHAWDAIEDTHPQATMKHLISRMGVDRHDVAEWEHPLEGPQSPDRVALVAQAFRPAAAWQAPKSGGQNKADGEPISGLHYMECAGPEYEARAIAVVLREALETPNRTAALVTPDRDLARRVAAELTRWGLKIDDSAGVPLAQTLVGSFLRLTADMIAQQIAPVPLLAALKHPLACGGTDGGRFRAQVRRLEHTVLRGTRPSPGFDGLDRALKSLKTPRPGLQDWLKPIAVAAADFDSEIAKKGDGDLAKLVRAHVQFAEFLAGNDETPGDQRLWAHGDGEAASVWVSEVLAAAGAAPNIDGRHYPLVLDALMVGSVVRPAYGRHPRLHIWGTLEARLQQTDVLVLGGLNEGTWPMEPNPDPWLSRPMRASAGLPLPEQRVGLAAHDFVQAISAPVAVLTRATKVGGQPTVPSRWLERLRATMNGQGLRFAPSPWLTWQSTLDQPATDQAQAPMDAPAPTPPLAARPRELSATQIETWVRDPYGIYARHILGLRALDAIDENADAADRGTIIHETLDQFVKAFPTTIPDDGAEQLLEIGRDVFGDLIDQPGIWAFWWPRFERVAGWFVAHERGRRLVAQVVGSEVKGILDLAAPGGTFRLTAVADRIEKLGDGTLAIVDYKTGMPPKNQEVESGFSPQLPVEAVIAQAGGFEDIDAAETREFAIWQLSGGGAGGKVFKFGKLDLPETITKTRDGLEIFIAAFDELSMPYRSHPRPDNGPRFSDYDHLARVKEWSAGGGGDE